MSKQDILQKDYTINRKVFQLKLPLNIEQTIPEDDSVHLLSQFVEEMDLLDLYSTYSRILDKKASPKQLLKIVLYSFMNRIFSTRDMEKCCRRDINFMYLLEGSPVPDHTTFARFISNHFAPFSENIMAEMSNFLYEIGEVSGENIFIDGTKIEACANRYTFVWKKSVTKNMEKKLQQIADFVAECEQVYEIKLIHNGQVKIKHLKKLRKKFLKIKIENNIEFVHGAGKRKTPLQRSIEKLEEYLDKLKEYTKKIHICGERNSYSKTDTDATFMRMKEDAMKNGQLKPAYNIQHGVDAEYIVWLAVGPEPSDVTTLVPFLKNMESHLKFKYKNIVADAGYESEENYVFIEENRQIAYIKPSNYEISKKRKYKNDIGRIENMEYNKSDDYYVCENGKRLTVNNVVKKKTKTGYESEKTIYTCEDCTECHHKTRCIKGHNCKTPIEDRTKNIETSKVFNNQRRKCLERITSEEGCQLRVNRSIQVEGSFGELKQDVGFRRFLRKGKNNVLAETILLAMAHNISKLHNKIQAERTGTHLFIITKSA